jgi:hypothetical protein
LAKSSVDVREDVAAGCVLETGGAWYAKSDSFFLGHAQKLWLCFFT